MSLAAVSGPAEQHHVMAAVAVGGPDLGAVDAVAAVDRDCPRSRRCQVGADIRLAQSDTDEAGAGGNPRQDFKALLFGARPQQQRTRLPIGNPVCRDRRAMRQHLFEHHIAFECGSLMTAVALRPGHADQAALAHLRAELGTPAVPAFGALQGGAAGQFGLEEVSYLTPQFFRFGTERRHGKRELVHHRATPISVMPYHSRAGPPSIAAWPIRRLHSVSLPNSSRHDNSRLV